MSRACVTCPLGGRGGGDPRMGLTMRLWAVLCFQGIARSIPRKVEFKRRCCELLRREGAVQTSLVRARRPCYNRAILALFDRSARTALIPLRALSAQWGCLKIEEVEPGSVQQRHRLLISRGFQPGDSRAVRVWLRWRLGDAQRSCGLLVRRGFRPADSGAIRV